MAFKPLIALHKNADGKILDAGAFDYSFKIADWLRALDIQPGDRVEFGEKVVRKEAEAALVEVAEYGTGTLVAVGKPAKVSA